MEIKQALGELYARLASTPDVEALDRAEIDALVKHLRRLAPDELLADDKFGSDFEHSLEMLPDFYGVKAREICPISSWPTRDWACGPALIRGNPKFLLQVGPYSDWDELQAHWDRDLPTTALLFALGGLHDDAQLIVHLLEGETVERPPREEHRTFFLRDGTLRELVEHYTYGDGRPRLPLFEVTIWDLFLDRALPAAKWQVYPPGRLRPAVFIPSSTGDGPSKDQDETVSKGKRLTMGEWTFPFGRCPVCKNVFFRPRRGKPRRYCSETCKVRGIPFAARRTEHVRKRRRAIRDDEIAIARQVIASVPETQQVDRLRKHFKGKKSRPQLQNLLRRARRRGAKESVPKPCE